jgi:hypothetical protein
MRAHFLTTTAVMALLYNIDARPDQLDRNKLIGLWFAAGNWSAGVPTALTNANIDTVTPNATVVGTGGATAGNLSVGQGGIGGLTIQGGTLSDVLGAIGNGATMILLSYRYGLRASELSSLRWEQVDLAHEHRTLAVGARWTPPR